MKFLIAGLGSIGRRHLRNLITLGERDLLLLRSSRSSYPDEELSGFPVETEIEAALSHHPQAVIVSNPTALHMEVAIPAAEAGCHLLLEKPVSHSNRRIEELRAAAQRGGGKVLVGYQFRFHPGLQRVRSLLNEGAVGRPLTVRAHWGEYLPGWHPWEDYRTGFSARADLGGGAILTLSHPLDYLRWMFGEVDKLWAFAGKLGDLELDVEDTAEIGLHFQSGTLGSVHLDYNQRPPAHTLEIIGTQDTLHWDNADGMVRVQQQQETYPLPAGFERNDLFLAEIRHFLAVARGEAQPICSLEDGIQALNLALAACQSGGLGQLIQIET